MENSKTERLDKVLAHHGFGTRKDVKKLLHSCSVTVNGQVCTSPDAHINPELDVLCVDGEAVVIRQNVYLMMNKCADVVCSAKDGLHRTVFDLLDEDYNHASSGGTLHLIGRLDIDTEGLLLLTTDGNLTHSLTSPKTHVPKTYIAGLRDVLTETQKADYIKRFASGIHIDAEGSEDACDCQSAELSFLDESLNGKLCAKLTIYEGKYHQVKRMFAALGNEVVYLKRIAVGDVALDETLQLGEYRELTEAELAILKA